MSPRRTERPITAVRPDETLSRLIAEQERDSRSYRVGGLHFTPRPGSHRDAAAEWDNAVRVIEDAL